MDYFKPKNTAHAYLLTRPRPTADANWACYISSGDRFEAFIDKSVLNQIHQEGKQGAPDETFGLLAGRVWRDAGGPYTLVIASAGARRNEIEATPSHVRISGDGIAQVRERLEASNPALEVVGWYHSHPNSRAQFSATDRVEQSTRSDPNHIGIVYSALPGEMPYGIYRGPEAVMLSPKRTAILPVPPLGDPVGPADLHAPRFIAEGEKAAAQEAASREDRRPPPDAAFVRETATYRDPGNSGSSQRANNLLVWIIAVGFLGTILSTILVSHRVQALQTQLGSAHATHQALESSHPAPGYRDPQEAGPADSPNGGQTPDTRQPQTSTENTAGAPESGDAAQTQDNQKTRTGSGRKSSTKDKPKANATDADSTTRTPQGEAPPPATKKARDQ